MRQLTLPLTIQNVDTVSKLPMRQLTVDDAVKEGTQLF